MEVLKTFRHEHKYRINKIEMYNIRDKLMELMPVDRNIDGYMVRSLYFDSINNIDYYDKLGGLYNRKKIRLRIYENNPSYAKLEIKKKSDNHQLKESVVVSRDVANSLIKGDYQVLLNLNSDVALEIYDIMMSNCYRPKCIIEYERIAFMSNTTTRVTLDYNIRRSNDIDSFLNGDINYLGLTNYNEAVLEVKFDRFLEPYIGKVLNNFVTNNESVSKYVMGRNVE